MSGKNANFKFNFCSFTLRGVLRKGFGGET